jgi:hypothetical protein
LSENLTATHNAILSIRLRRELPPVYAAPVMKKPTPEMKQRMCTRKRRYRTQGDALDAALLVGVERQRSAYRCTLCGLWHLTTS